MSNRQERKARKAAVRNGDTSQQFFHEPKRPTGTYRTREQRDGDRKARAHLRNLVSSPARAQAALAKIEADLQKQVNDKS